MRPSYKTVFRVVKKKLCAMFKFTFTEETLQPAQVVQTKMLRNEAKIYQETDFFSTKGHL